MKSLNCTQFQSYTLERLERNGIDLKSSAAVHVLELAMLCDQQTNDVHARLQRVKHETDRRLHILNNDDCLNDDAALNLGQAMEGFAQDAQRAESLALQLQLGKKMLQMAMQNLLGGK